MSLHGIPKDILREVGLEPDEPRNNVATLRQISGNDAAPEFPTSALPKPVARLVEESADAIGCPSDALVHIQNRCRVRRYSGNHETSHLRCCHSRFG